MTRTDVTSGNEIPVGETTRGAGLCVGQEMLTIPLSRRVRLADQRLKLTISTTLGASVNLRMGPGTYLRATSFIGTS